ncbi:MAG: NAD(+)/NADH kinase [Actinobacteria bacterium]|nr:NAD(+)/NADH kinase [Actinomycetota bacterium]
MKAVGFVVHPGRPAAAKAAESLVAWLRERDVENRTLDGTEADAGTEAEIDARARSFTEGLDLIVSVGGDGTFLRAARLASRSTVPVLGVKAGRMGFLTEVEPEDAPAVLSRMLDGAARIEERLAVIAEGASFAPQWALNEVIVEKSARHRLIRLAVFVDDAYVTTFSADGVISATPTGSTAYSFSAGGPIVSPSVPCLVVTPVAAHMVFDRSLVLGAEQRVRLEVLGEEPGLLSADGRQSLELPVGTTVEIRRAEEPARLVRQEDAPAFHELVRDKFELPGDVGGRG